MDYKIKWKNKDYLSLGNAVYNFNKKIDKLQKEENKLYLPEKITYKDIKEEILTRKELNRVIRSLRNFTKKDSEELLVLKSGQQITKWELQELNKQKRLYKNRLTKELQQLYIAKPGEKFSRAEMGSMRLREINRQLESLENIENLKGYEFERKKELIKNRGSYDYILRKSETYRENFLKELKDLAKSSDLFNDVYKYFENIKNPITFFETTQRSNVLQDFFVWYQVPEHYASFSNKEDLAEYILKEYGVENFNEI